MGYELPKLNLGGLLSQLCEAEDQLARLDERVARSAVGQGFAERLHFVDACSAMWIAGELVQLEDLVLHDAYMDARAPSHELTQANAILRLRRRLARLDGSHDITTTAGLARLRGRPVPNGQERGGGAAADPSSAASTSSTTLGRWTKTGWLRERKGSRQSLPQHYTNPQAPISPLRDSGG